MLKRTLLIGLLLLALSPVQSFARSYIVEAIVFSNDGATGGSAERWDPDTLSSLKSQNKIRAQHAKARKLNSPRSLNTLAGVHQRLASSPEHRILKTLSWTQSEAGYARSPLIQFSAANLIGAIKVYAPNLLFSEVTLRFSPSGAASLSDVNTAGNSGEIIRSSSPSYFLDEKRRLKLKEIHYFDHPKFGVILSVRPI